MKINDILYGFKVTDVTDVASIDAKMYLMEHEKTGAKLCYINRCDESRTFGITFRTPPTDDTGVFHILEHSVLCGSEKFPTKEPFTELLKGSLNTFLNALTYSDRTSYPVASRNDKDFYNLVDVYMDAVFNPKAISDERIFRQEGWRYEADEGGSVEYNGVVYSEMKGVYSSADSIAAYHNARLLFPGGTYSYDSGGHPDAITDLGYEDFVNAHKKHYHPSGAYIFLDGEPRLDEILPLIDRYLSRYERKVMDLPILRGGEVITEPLYERYEIDESESGEDKTKLYLTYVTREYSDVLANSVLSAITDAVADSNEAPLKKAILDSGLCDNVYLYHTPGCMWGTLNVEFRGVKDGRERELIAHFDKCTADMLERGIDRALLFASCDRLEFKTRESDFGSTPKGIVYLSAISDLWIYGSHPAIALDYESSFLQLREAISGDYPERLLSDILSSPRATLVLTPSKELALEREAATSEKLSRRISELSAKEASSLRERTVAFERWQERPDTEEALATIPTLSIEDLSKEPRKIPTIVSKYRGVDLVDHPIATGGITYTEMYFDASDTVSEDIPALVLMTMLYPNLDTARGSANDFRRRSKSALGAISLSPDAAKRSGEAKFYLKLSTSSLDTKRDTALELALEYLFDTVLENREALRRTLIQKTALYADIMTESGHSIAVSRAAASQTAFDAIKEYTRGYELYSFLKRTKDVSDAELDRLIEKMSLMRSRIFVRERLTVGTTGKDCEAFARACTDAMPHGEPSCPSEIMPLPRRREGIAIPSQVSYAALASNLFASGAASLHNGAWSTLATILDFEILWEEVRVKGGAYGTGFTCRANSGTAVFYSYRDPSPARTLGVYLNSPELLAKRLRGEVDLEKLIIGTVGASEQVSTPASDGNGETALYLAGKSYEDVLKSRIECIGTTKEKLSELGEQLSAMLRTPSIAVVGPREQLENLGLDEILEI